MKIRPDAIHDCEVGEIIYKFRTPTPFDIPQLRWALTKRKVRRPQLIELKVAALAGIAALGEQAGETEEAERQREVYERWYDLLEPIREDDIDEPDPEKRAAELARQLRARAEDQQLIVAEVAAIEANLARHWDPYADLIADRQFWDELSKVEVVRLLLVKIGDQQQPLDEHQMLAFDAYMALPHDHLPALQAFAQDLITPTESERGN